MMYHHLLPCLKCRIHGEYLRGVEKDQRLSKGPPIYLEKLVEGLVERNIPSVQKCKRSMATGFGDFTSCRIVLDATKIRMFLVMM